MKTVTFEGNQYDVPDWVSFLARDKDGTIMAFDNEPYTFNDAWAAKKGQVGIVILGGINWQKSLTEV